MDAENLTMVRVGGVDKHVSFYTGKLLNKVGERLDEYVNNEYNDEDIEKQCDHVIDKCCGDNVSVWFQPVNIRMRFDFGVDRALFDILAIIRMRNPKTGKVTELSHIFADFEYEYGIYDDYAYYGCKQSDF